MKQAYTSTVFKYNGALHEVVGTSEGKVIYHRPINAVPCIACGEIKEFATVESSPQFQDNSSPVETLVDEE